MQPQSKVITPNYTERVFKAIDWLLIANQVCHGNGFAHSWSPIFGWKAAYPETTGYLIPTLLRLHRVPEICAHYAVQNIDLKSLAIHQGNWLLSLQLPSGAFPGLLAGNKTPSVFNTGMIMYGLTALLISPSANARLDTIAYHAALSKAADYLRSSMDSDGLWRTDTYIRGYSPAYHVYAFAALLDYEQTTYGQLTKTIKTQYTQAIESYLRYWQNDGSIDDCGFWKDRSAYTHTIAYALHGLWKVRNFDQALHQACTTAVQSTLLPFVQEINTTGKLAGAYWPRHSWFSCLTGDAQIANLLYITARAASNQANKGAADLLLKHVFAHQKHTGTARGALAGSAPLFGPYLSLRYPNWAVKYLLDAWLESAGYHTID